MKLSRLIVLLAIVVSCNSKPEKKEKADRGELLNTMIDHELRSGKEKIYLISLSTKIPYDTVRQIIKDYYLMGYKRMFDNPASLLDSSIVDIKESVQTISKKHKLTESKVATLLFSYKYEIRSPDEIIEEYQDQQVDYRDYEQQ